MARRAHQELLSLLLLPNLLSFRAPVVANSNSELSTRYVSYQVVTSEQSLFTTLHKLADVPFRPYTKGTQFNRQTNHWRPEALLQCVAFRPCDRSIPHLLRHQLCDRREV